MAKYQSKRDEKIATMVGKEPDGTFTFKFEDGSEKKLSESTVKRWWKQVEEVEDLTNVPLETIPDATSYPCDVKTEAAPEITPDTTPDQVDEQPKPKKSKKSSKKSSRILIEEHIRKALVAEINMVASKYGCEKSPVGKVKDNYALRKDNISKAVYVDSPYHVTLWVKSKAVGELDITGINGVEIKRASHCFDIRVKFTDLNSKSKNLIEELLEKSVTYVNRRKK